MAHFWVNNVGIILVTYLTYTNKFLRLRRLRLIVRLNASFVQNIKIILFVPIVLISKNLKSKQIVETKLFLLTSVIP